MSAERAKGRERRGRRKRTTNVSPGGNTDR